jgi:predicted flap endonuclease-1-like 5' DNA nuclease
MDHEAFRRFLKRGGRSESAINRCVRYVGEFETYLQQHHDGAGLGSADPDKLEAFVSWLERKPKTSAKTHLWALGYYYEYTADDDMRALAGALRQERITRRPFALRDFRGVNQDHVKALAAAGIKDMKQMREAGRTPRHREALSARTGVPLDAILEFVKLSDLARIPGVQSIRARLYHDAGVDTLEKMAEWDPEELRSMLLEFVEQTGFDGIAPLPKEAAYSVAKAKELPKIIEY